MAVALTAGVTFFQYRNKNDSRKHIYEAALLIVNDHADIAAAVDAHGVHLGQDDLPIECARKLLGKEKLIGISTHNAEEARAAQAAGADYIGFGPIFPTPTKATGDAQGCARISGIKQTVSIPVIAIGGITHENVQDVMRAGADGAAVISAVLSAPDPGLAAKKMLELLGNREA
jgi:thiamine-phosphate pyrophosphorylase